MVLNAESVRTTPNAFILTLLSITIVFLALICLSYTYTLISIVVNRQFRCGRKQKSDKPTKKEAAAIATAIQMYMNEEMHDVESYVITIKRKQ